MRVGKSKPTESEVPAGKQKRGYSFMAEGGRVADPSTEVEILLYKVRMAEDALRKFSGNSAAQAMYDYDEKKAELQKALDEARANLKAYQNRKKEGNVEVGKFLSSEKIDMLKKKSK